MKNNPALRFQTGCTLVLVLVALGGCSTIKSISPFGSNVPYSENVQPTVPKPTTPDKPVYPTGKAPPPGSSGSSSPSVAPSNEDIIRRDGLSGDSSPQADTPAVKTPKKAPEISEDRRKFKDDGSYPNLAQVPARPTDLPTFAEAQAEQKALEADAAKASTPNATATAAVAPAAPKPNVPNLAVTARPEDRSPCLDEVANGATPAASVSFGEGSAALTADEREVLAEAIPEFRAGKGAIRIFGQGDSATDPNAGRFRLAIARAGAVAQALAGYGVPPSRIAVGVACTDSALSASSVHLFVES